LQTATLPLGYPAENSEAPNIRTWHADVNVWPILSEVME
jgi:hypothetical protein